MKLFYLLLVAILLPATNPTHAQETVSIDVFHQTLEPYGDWREVGDYGYCWQPRNVDRNWRPYTDGHWVYTDAGWTWVSDEPYGWAVYHYGRWTQVERVGWVWVPGSQWGPAWVSWRRSPRHVGWAPLPPEAKFDRSHGISGRVDVEYEIGPTHYTFVEVRNFGAPRLRKVIIEPRQNITIINQTTNITQITYVNSLVYNQGPQYEVISRESVEPIRRLRLERRERFEADPGSLRAEQLQPQVQGDSLRVVAVPIDPKPATAPSKVLPKVEKVEIDHGWKNAGPPAAVAKLRNKLKSEPVPAPVEPQVEAEKPGVTKPGTGTTPATQTPAPAQTDKATPTPDKGAKPPGTDTTQPTPPAPGTGTPASTPTPKATPKPGKGSKQPKPDTGTAQPAPPTETPAPPQTATPSQKPRTGAPQPRADNLQPDTDTPALPQTERPKSRKGATPPKDVTDSTKPSSQAVSPSTDADTVKPRNKGSRKASGSPQEAPQTVPEDSGQKLKKEKNASALEKPRGDEAATTASSRGKTKDKARPEPQMQPSPRGKAPSDQPQQPVQRPIPAPEQRKVNRPDRERRPPEQAPARNVERRPRPEQRPEAESRPQPRRPESPQAAGSTNPQSAGPAKDKDKGKNKGEQKSGE